MARPADARHFELWLTASIGPAGEEGEELEKWNPALVEQAIRDLCFRTEGKDWAAIGQILSRYGHWELENYVKSKDSGPPS